MAIKELRERLSMTQRDLAVANGMDLQKYQRIEKGLGFQSDYLKIKYYLESELSNINYLLRREKYEAISDKYGIEITDQLTSLDIITVKTNLSYYMVCYDHHRLVRFNAKLRKIKGNVPCPIFDQETEIVLKIIKELNSVKIEQL